MEARHIRAEPRSQSSPRRPPARRGFLKIAQMLLRTILPACLLASVCHSVPLSPESAARLALAHHPRLAAARSLIAEAESRAAGLGRLPNPELETAIAAGSRGDGRIEIGLDQVFPNTKRLRLERRAASEAITLTRLEVALAEADIALQVQLAVVELAASDAVLQLAESQAALAQSQAAVWRDQAAAGQFSALDADQAELIAREKKLAVAERRAHRLAASAAVAVALGPPHTEVPEVVYDLSLPATPPSPPVAARRADLARADAYIALGEAEISLARSQGRESWRAGVFVEAEREFDVFGRRETDARLGLRFNLPVPLRAVHAPVLAEKTIARQRLALERDALAAEIRHEIALAAAILADHHRAARALAVDLLPAARAHVVAVEAARARGEADLARLFFAQERVAELERSELAARHAYHLAHVRMLAATGRLAP